MFNRFREVLKIEEPSRSESSILNNNAQETIVESNEMLTLLEQQKDNFPTLKNFIIGKPIYPSLVFLPQTLKQIDAEFTHNQDLLLDCLSFLDVVKTYSLVVYGNPDTFTSNISKLIVDNRTVLSHNNCLAKDSIDDFIFSKQEDAYEFLENNKLVLSLYIFSLISLLFYESQR